MAASETYNNVLLISFSIALHNHALDFLCSLSKFNAYFNKCTGQY